MMTFLEETRQINYNHHAYRKHMSTMTTMLQLMDTLFEAADNNEVSTVMTVDESLAFDCVPHWILLEKLRLYNFDNSALKLVSIIYFAQITICHN